MGKERNPNAGNGKGAYRGSSGKTHKNSSGKTEGSENSIEIDFSRFKLKVGDVSTLSKWRLGVQALCTSKVGKYATKIDTDPNEPAIPMVDEAAIMLRAGNNERLGNKLIEAQHADNVKTWSKCARELSTLYPFIWKSMHTDLQESMKRHPSFQQIYDNLNVRGLIQLAIKVCNKTSTNTYMREVMATQALCNFRTNSNFQGAMKQFIALVEDYCQKAHSNYVDKAHYDGQFILSIEDWKDENMPGEKQVAYFLSSMSATNFGDFRTHILDKKQSKFPKNLGALSVEFDNFIQNRKSHDAPKPEKPSKPNHKHPQSAEEPTEQAMYTHGGKKGDVKGKGWKAQDKGKKEFSKSKRENTESSSKESVQALVNKQLKQILPEIINQLKKRESGKKKSHQSTEDSDDDSSAEISKSEAQAFLTKYLGEEGEEDYNPPKAKKNKKQKKGSDSDYSAMAFSSVEPDFAGMVFSLNPSIADADFASIMSSTFDNSALSATEMVPIQHDLYPAFMDSGCTLALTGDPSYLSNMRLLPTPRTIGSAKSGGKIVAKSCGILYNQIPMYFSNDTSATLIGRGVLMRWGKYWFSDGNESERRNCIPDGVPRDYWRSNKNGEVWMFSPLSNRLSKLSAILSSSDFENILSQYHTSSDVSFYTYKRSGEHETVSENRKLYTADENRRADSARAVQNALSSMNARQIALTIAQGGIQGDINAKDFIMADRIFGHSEGILKGKTKNRAVKSANIEPIRPTLIGLLREQQDLYCDLFFIAGHTILIAVSQPMDFTHIIWIRDKTQENLEHALKMIISDYTAGSFRVNNVYWDKESGIVTLRLGQVKVVVKRGRSCVEIAERKIQTIKANHRADTTVNTNPLTCYGVLHVWGAYWAVDSINFLVSMKNPTNPPPHVQLYGYPLTLNQVGLYPFMKYGHVTEPVPDIEKNQTNKSRARMVILIRRGQTPHDTATFLDLDSFLFNAPYKFVTIERKLQQFVPQPVPEIVIRAWNEQIALKKAYIEPNFIYRNSEVEDPPSDDPPAVPIAGVQQQVHPAGVQQQAAEVPANGDDQEQMDTISVQATVQQAASSTRTRIYSNLDPLLLAAPSKNRDPDQSAVDADVRGQLKRYTLEFPDLEPRAGSGAHKPPPKLQADPPTSITRVHQPLPEGRGGKAAASSSSSKSKAKREVQDLTCATSGHGVIPEKADDPPFEFDQGTGTFKPTSRKRGRDTTLPSPDDLQPSKQEKLRAAIKVKEHIRHGHGTRAAGRQTDIGDQAFMTSIQTRVSKKSLERIPEEGNIRVLTLDAITSELVILDEKEVFSPTFLKDLSKSQLKKVLSSSMFTVCKYGADGQFIKVKARLVAGGHRQIHSMYDPDDIASPTAATTSVFMVSHIAAAERRKVMTCDITAAYLNADLPNDPDGEPIVMYLDPILAQLLCREKPEYKSYIDDSGRLYVKLNKALYGCIQSAKLWYDTLVTDLADYGFVANPYDPCVLNADFQGKQCTIALHVDDLLVTCVDENVLKSLEKFIQSKYKGVTAKYGPVHEYLGMIFDFSIDGQVSIWQPAVIETLCSTVAQSTAKTPAGNGLFTEAQNSPLLPQHGKTLFHSMVASCLYLAKRTRPDILLPVSYLTTRVQAPSLQDLNKLERVLRYLKSTIDKKLILRASKSGIRVRCYVDASYNVHSKAKSHTGIIISLGHGAIFAKSTKQKLTVDSSTQAELVSLHSSMKEVLWCKKFLKFQGIPTDPVLVYQDNKSTIQLASHGSKRCHRTKHMSVKFWTIKSLIKTGKVEIQYLNTSRMVADVLTKPLQGGQFLTFVHKLMGYKIPQQL